ncbi:MAG: hypothetical protein BRD23_00460 [Halobacteriales archaeon SW_9_67_25]|jgi:hypothetical protein|nr:MAG: hypothetical protein BRD23_00460 [Halobacteriales archaeon SW_9_67_25]
MDAGEADETGEVTVTRMGLRDGGWIGYAEGAIFVQRDDEKVKISHSNVTQLSLRTLEWDLAVMSVVLLAVGTFVAITRNVYIGIVFGAVGVWSLARTYDDRHELIIHVDGRAKPVTVHPVDPGECHERLAEVAGLELQ